MHGRCIPRTDCESHSQHAQRRRARGGWAAAARPPVAPGPPLLSRSPRPSLRVPTVCSTLLTRRCSPDAQKIRVTDATGGRNEYVSLSLFDFFEFVCWAHGERTGVNAARDRSMRTTFQQDEPQPKAARAFLQQVYDLLTAFGKLPPADSMSLTTFLLGREFIREATLAAGVLCEVNADGSLGAPLALTAFQLDVQTKAPAEKEQRRIVKEHKMQLNKQRKAQGLPPLRTRQPQVTKPKVKAVQVGPQIGKKKGRGKQRERALEAVEAGDDDDDDDVVVMAEDEDKDGEDSEAEEEENEDDEDNYLPPLPPQSPLRDEQQQPLCDTHQAVAECGPVPAVCGPLFDLPSPVHTGAFEFHEPAPTHYSWPDFDLFDLPFDGDAVGSLQPSAPPGNAFAVAALD